MTPVPTTIPSEHPLPRVVLTDVDDTLTWEGRLPSVTLAAMERLAAAGQWFAERGGVEPGTAHDQALQALAHTLHQQAAYQAYGDAIYLQGLLMLLALGLMFALRRPAR